MPNPKVAETMRLIVADCQEDARKLDGAPFTGRVVAETFGATLAMLATVAEAVARLADDA